MTETDNISVNELFPVFLKLNQFNVLIIGGGVVGLEKLSAILNNSPKAKVTIVSYAFSDELIKFIQDNSNISLIEGVFEEYHLENKNIVISALNDIEMSAKIKKIVNSHGLLYNAADKPELCDFYLGSTVTKGNLKIGISTNGKSPTLAKRIRQFLEELLPEEINDLLDSLQNYRKTLDGDFEFKVNEMNKMTKSILERNDTN